MIDVYFNFTEQSFKQLRNKHSEIITKGPRYKLCSGINRTLYYISHISKFNFAMKRMFSNVYWHNACVHSFNCCR